MADVKQDRAWCLSGVGGVGVVAALLVAGFWYTSPPKPILIMCTNEDMCAELIDQRDNHVDPAVDGEGDYYHCPTKDECKVVSRDHSRRGNVDPNNVSQMANVFGRYRELHSAEDTSFHGGSMTSKIKSPYKADMYRNVVDALRESRMKLHVLLFGSCEKMVESVIKGSKMDVNEIECTNPSGQARIRNIFGTKHAIDDGHLVNSVVTFVIVPELDESNPEAKRIRVACAFGPDCTNTQTPDSDKRRGSALSRYEYFRRIGLIQSLAAVAPADFSGLTEDERKHRADNFNETWNLLIGHSGTGKTTLSVLLAYFGQVVESLRRSFTVAYASPSSHTMNMNCVKVGNYVSCDTRGLDVLDKKLIQSIVWYVQGRFDPTSRLPMQYYEDGDQETDKADRTHPLNMKPDPALAFHTVTYATKFINVSDPDFESEKGFVQELSKALSKIGVQVTFVVTHVNACKLQTLEGCRDQIADAFEIPRSKTVMLEKVEEYSSYGSNPFWLWWYGLDGSLDDEMVATTGTRLDPDSIYNFLKTSQHAADQFYRWKYADYKKSN
eukprot:m.467092 g.467092  ORF g.467092 m.467092 type:complete len:553 (+) comp25880_c0_seq1:25-1683(+)